MDEKQKPMKPATTKVQMICGQVRKLNEKREIERLELAPVGAMMQQIIRM